MENELRREKRVEGEKMKVGEFAKHHWKKWQANGKLIFQEK